MKDIYDIKDIFLGFPIDLFYSVIFLVIIFVLYIYYKIISNKKPRNVNQVNKGVPKIDFSFMIGNIEKNYISLSSDIFYSKLLEVLRIFLEEKGNKNLSKMTFEEINNLDLDNSLKDIIKVIYYKEYVKEIDDNNDIRLDLINKIKKLIK